MNPDDVEEDLDGGTDGPDPIEVSKRLAYLINLVDLDEDQETYLIDACESAQYFDDLPDDVKMFFAHSEQQFGVAPGYENVVAKRTAETMKRID